MPFLCKEFGYGLGFDLLAGLVEMVVYDFHQTTPPSTVALPPAGKLDSEFPEIVPINIFAEVYAGLPECGAMLEDIAKPLQ